MTEVALVEENAVEESKPSTELMGVSSAAIQELQKVYAATGGDEMAAAVLDAAKNVSSPLHKYFEWDDTKAAAEYRLLQAESLIRRVKVRILKGDDSPPRVIRAFIATKELPSAGAQNRGSFTAIEDIAGESDKEAELLASIERDLQALRSKYAGAEELFEIALQNTQP